MTASQDLRSVSALRDLEAKATPGPWKWDEETIRGKDRNAIFYPHSPRLTVRELCNRDEDADFIVAARNVFPLLLDVVEAAQALARNSYGCIPQRAHYKLREALAALKAQT
jgi:hypothetical protein